MRVQARKILAVSGAVTLEQAALIYIDGVSDQRWIGKHRQHWSNILANFAYPIIGELSVEAIGVKDIVHVLQLI